MNPLGTAIRRRGRWLLVPMLATCLGLMMPGGAAHAALQEIAQARIEAPGPSTRVALPIVLPASTAASGALARIEFQHPGPPSQPWAVLLPYLTYGGDVRINGMLAATVQENTSRISVRFVRPHLVLLAPALLRSGTNELVIRAAPGPPGGSVRVPRVVVGPQAEVLPVYERRGFWVLDVPEITAAACLLGAAAVLFIWWRRRSETLYGLFGVALALWGLRTLTFVVEVLPTPAWMWWRLVYHAANGGFIIVMTVLAWRLAGIRIAWFERALVAYWLIGPAWLLSQGMPAEGLLNRYWVAGFIPIGASIIAVSAWSLVRRPTLQAAALPATMGLAALAGIHDYLVAWDLMPDLPGLQAWAAHRIYLLHHGASLVLVTMGALITIRFVDALSHSERMNQTLEARVQERERALAENYLRLSALQRERAAAQERQRIMRDIHDGLGSRLFVALSRVERGAMDQAEIAQALRGCIAEMRLALDTVAPQVEDFRSVLGNFLFRWRDQLQGGGVRLEWQIDVPDHALTLAPHAALQLLRVAQEALTNVLKHAHAGLVSVNLSRSGAMLVFQVQDDGRTVEDGMTPEVSAAGHGMANMRSRIEQLRGNIEFVREPTGMRVTIRVPLRAVAAGAAEETMATAGAPVGPSQIHAMAHADRRDVAGGLLS